ncbi:hypothetical protein [Clavibacter californiensis]|uniref:Lipoprotein n=1 Tax=Clavibacter californiensis TaxID=1401995 RepID=A0ABX9N9J8_9MICO|nr:hypothetical protein [Clavibacter californiensis]RII94896.1 hypothetical protein DZF98_00305 [Clavibacter californiensis]UKF81657.1 hypothetical protein FGD68_15300 [Clavibacter californiensis]
MRNLYAAIAAGVMLIIVSSCSEPSASTPTPTATARMSFDDGLLTIQQYRAADGSYNSATARLAGPLSFEDGCIRVGGYTVVVPRPATWDGETLTVGDQSFTLGDELDMVGGYAQNRQPGQPDDCPGETFFASGVEPLADEP